MRTTDEAHQSPETLIRAVYEVLSGSATETRDWDRFRTFYHPDARLMPLRREQNGNVLVDVFDIESYIASRTAILSQADFFETEVAVEVFRFGNLAHALSTYESRRNRSDAPFATGINSYQMYTDGNRWRILSGTWEQSIMNEQPNVPRSGAVGDCP